MKAQQDVYITGDRKRAVVAGDLDARFLLARAGQEVSDEKAEEIEDAVALLSATPKREAPKKDSSKDLQERAPKAAKKAK